MVDQLMKDGRYRPVKIYTDATKSDGDKIIIHRNNHDYGYRKFVALGVLYPVTNDFKIMDGTIFRDTDSFQVRPKLIYKSSLGFYVKLKKGRVYLSDDYLEWIVKEYPEYESALNRDWEF